VIFNRKISLNLGAYFGLYHRFCVWKQMEESIAKRKRKTNGNTWPDFPSVHRDTLARHIMTPGPGLTKTENGGKFSVFVKRHGHFF
jgi:hypothetical protein